MLNIRLTSIKINATNNLEYKDIEPKDYNYTCYNTKVVHLVFITCSVKNKND